MLLCPNCPTTVRSDAVALLSRSMADRPVRHVDPQYPMCLRVTVTDVERDHITWDWISQGTLLTQCRAVSSVWAVVVRRLMTDCSRWKSSIDPGAISGRRPFRRACRGTASSASGPDGRWGRSPNNRGVLCCSIAPRSPLIGKLPPEFTERRAIWREWPLSVVARHEPSACDEIQRAKFSGQSARASSARTAPAIRRSWSSALSGMTIIVN